ncbi:hypothetical protein JOJ86_002580 [Rhodococcus percolatus]|uniref:DUF4012 domain-containing protein n=1 Tax=Rhodococcus opacus TaxID=37919 RepID=UPI0015FB42CE|nr:DUF4012 domain-containing protein [Rhodococcus opacus]MBA8959289.1 hypothetical protein [Rhodococcus opacus]MBP2204854.1 hypothetical protein [Rhodococcus opacus]
MGTNDKSVSHVEDSPSGDTVPGPARRRRRYVLAGTGVLALAVIGWFGYSAWDVQHDLTGARDNAQLAKNSLLGGDTEGARNAAAEAVTQAENAQVSLHSAPWRQLAGIPGVGAPFESIQRMSDVVVGLTRDVLAPAVETGTALSPGDLISDGGKVKLQPLREAAPALKQTSLAARALADQAHQVPGAGYLGPIDDVRSELQNQTDDVAKLLENTAIGADILPAMMGADGPRNYFMAFQTNAEARGTGGLVGGYGIIRANDGEVQVDTLGKNTEVSYEHQPLDLGSDFNGLYGSYNPSTDIRNSNLSTHFPYAGQIWQSLWAQESGEQVDGAIATDPVALSYVLGAVGPVTMPDGEVVDAGNVVELTESTAYIRYAGVSDTEIVANNVARKTYLQTIAAKVVEKMTGNIASPQLLLDAIGKAVSERRIAVWSAHPEEQAVLAGTPLGHTVPEDDAPYASVVVNNNAGNKLDYYLTREIDYTAETCTGDTRTSEVTVRLTNNLPAGDYPRYVAGTYNNRQVPPGTNVAMISLLATRGAKLDKATVNGRPAFTVNGNELGHPVFSIPTTVPRGETVELRYALTEPTVPGAARVPVQPLVDDPKVTVNVPACGD